MIGRALAADPSSAERFMQAIEAEPAQQRVSEVITLPARPEPPPAMP